MLIKFSVKAQGTSHIEKETPCQDAVTAHLGKNKTMGIACVADGHGGSKYFRSEKGSIFAVQVAERALMEFYRAIAIEKSAFFHRNSPNEDIKDNNIRSKLKELEGNIIYKWQNTVIKDMEQNPFTEKEIEICKDNNIIIDNYENLTYVYGSTLLAGLVSDSFWFVIQIGDGQCVVLENDDNIIFPITEDERLAFGRTTSLCDNNAIENFREVFGINKIIGLTVATDGITDSFEPEKYLQFNKELHYNFTHFPEKAELELSEFLPELSERGSRDDVSIAGIFRMEDKKI